MMSLLTIVLTLLTLLSAGQGEQVSQLGPELRLSPLEDGAVTMTDHGQAHHHSLVLDTPQQHPDDVSSLITTQQHLMLSAQVVVGQDNDGLLGALHGFVHHTLATEV